MQERGMSARNIYPRRSGWVSLEKKKSQRTTETGRNNKNVVTQHTSRRRRRGLRRPAAHPSRVERGPWKQFPFSELLNESSQESTKSSFRSPDANHHHAEQTEQSSLRASPSLTFLNEPIKLHTESMPYSLVSYTPSLSLSDPTPAGTNDEPRPGERVQKSFLSRIVSFPGRVLSSSETVSQSLASCGHVRFGALLASRRGVSSYLHRALVSVQFPWSFESISKQKKILKRRFGSFL